jgi:hypothetical protein
MRRRFISAAIILVSVIMTVSQNPVSVLAEEVVTDVTDGDVIDDSSEFLPDDSAIPENSPDTDTTEEEVPGEMPDTDEELPEEQPPDGQAPEEQLPDEEPSDEEQDGEQNGEENPDDGDEIYLGEDIVDKLREDTVSPADDKETNHTNNSQKNYSKTTCRDLPETGETEDLIIWTCILLFTAACAILLIIFAYHITFSK